MYKCNAATCVDVYQAALMRRGTPKHACLQIVLYAPVSMTFPGEGVKIIFQVFPGWHEKSDIFQGSLKKFPKAKKSDF